MTENKNLKMADVPKILPLTNDMVFKRVFSREGNRSMLKSLLEAILRVKIKSVEVKNPELVPNFEGDKAGQLDIKVVINDDTICDVEMQMKNEHNIDTRSLKYSGKVFTDQLDEGDRYTDLKKTIVIFIMNFNYYKRNSYHNVAKVGFMKTLPEEYVDMKYEKEDEVASEYLEFHYIELPKFRKKLKEMANTKLEKWLCLILGKEEKIDMNDKENKELKEASEKVKEFSMNKEEREIYMSRLVAKSCYYDDLHLAEEKGIKKEKIEIAKKMLADKIDIEIIIKYTRSYKRRSRKIIIKK